MFYDVLMKLCHQCIKIFYEKDNILDIQKRLIVMKKLGFVSCLTQHTDLLEAIHNKDVKKKTNYDIEFA